MPLLEVLPFWEDLRQWLEVLKRVVGELRLRLHVLGGGGLEPNSVIPPPQAILRPYLAV